MIISRHWAVPTRLSRMVVCRQGRCPRVRLGRPSPVNGTTADLVGLDTSPELADPSKPPLAIENLGVSILNLNVIPVATAANKELHPGPKGRYRGPGKTPKPIRGLLGSHCFNLFKKSLTPAIVVVLLWYSLRVLGAITTGFLRPFVPRTNENETTTRLAPESRHAPRR